MWKIVFVDPNGWYAETETTQTYVDLDDPSIVALRVKQTYCHIAFVIGKSMHK